MFNLFKKIKPSKKPEVESGQVEAGVAEAGSTKEDIISEQDISIHTMPSRYRFAHAKVDQAKTTGIFIMVGGMIFMLAMAFVLYYFLFRQAPLQPKTTAITPTVEQPQTEVISPEPEPEESATTTESSGLAESENLPAASAQATSSPEMNGTENVSYSKGQDSDGDGLTDNEEQMLGTSLDNADSDGDGYSDLTELENLYNPAGAGKLLDNPSIKMYENLTYSYNLLYQKDWLPNTQGGDDSVMFKSGDNNFMQIIVQPNQANLTITDWYLAQFNLSDLPATSLIQADTWQGVKHTDNLTVYLMDKNGKNIYTFSYNPGTNSILEYENIFWLMVKSLVINN